MNSKAFLVALSIATMLTACSDPRIDTSSDDNFKMSMDKVIADLKGDDVAAFERSLRIVMTKDLSMATFMSALNDNTAPERFLANAKNEINGKTAKQVVQEAEGITAKRKEAERTQALAEIEELIARKNGAAEAERTLELFVVSKSRFRQEYERYSTYAQPVIQLTVTNGTKQSVSRAYFEGVLASPSRAVPWIKDTFNYKIAGGLEPGETVTWNLQPNKFGDWGKVEAPADAIFTVKPIRLDGPDGEAFLSATFSDAQAKRLATLIEQYKPQAAN